MKFSVYRYRFCFGFSVLLVLAACTRMEVKPLSRLNDQASSKQQWQRLLPIETLKADAILSWEAAQGDHGKYRVRLFLRSPEQLKIQWLTPWGSVAGQLLINDRQYWLSDSRRQETWHGRAVDLDKLLPDDKGEQLQTITSRFFKFWPLLFSGPAADAGNYADNLSVRYQSVGNGDDLNLTKTIAMSNGEPLQVRLFKMKKLENEKIMPQAVEISSASGRVGLRLRRYSLPAKFSPGTFVYSLKKFNLHEG